MRDDRKTIWLDQFQTRLLIRMSMYGAIYVITLMNLLFIWQLLAEGKGDLMEQYGRFLYDYSPAFFVLVLVCPVVAWDTLKFTHRLVGPLVRFRRTLQDMAAGQQVQLIKLREGDYLTELRDEFNAMLDAMQRLGVPVLKPATPPAEGDGQRNSA